MSNDSRRIEIIGKHGFYGAKKLMCDHIESANKVTPLQVKSWSVIDNCIEVEILCESRDSALRLERSIKVFSVPLSVML